MPTPIVIDLSHHNAIPQSLKAAAEAGIIGVIHKATEGGSYVDSDVDARWWLARDAGLLWGLYHFMRPGDQIAHARHFVEVATVYGDQDTLLVADHEDPAVSLYNLKVWLAEVERLTGRRPVIYSGHVLKEQLPAPDPELSGYLLWLAQYAAAPTMPKGFKSAWLWQYTANGKCPGVTPPTDLNAGDVADVRKRWSGAGGGVEQPVTTMAEITVDLSGTPGTIVNVTVDGDSVAKVAIPE